MNKLNFLPFRPTLPRGFTLVELLMSVGIVGVLTAVAYPSYMKSYAKGKRADAQIALLNMAAAQERFLADCGSYAAALGAHTACGAGRRVLDSRAVTGMTLYNLAIAAGDEDSFTLTATASPLGSQAHDVGCLTMTLQNTDGQLTMEPPSCWPVVLRAGQVDLSASTPSSAE